jgi:hypothetical protein
MADALPPRVNYIFVDFENVQETDLDRIAQKPVKVILVLGGQNKHLPVSLVKKLLQYAGQVQLVETGRTGRNASDLVLAHYIGEVKKSDPHGYIHILSKDKDFDALIGHYKLNGSLAARHASFSEIPVLMNVDERAQLLASYFTAEHVSRPSKRKTLESHMQAVFGKTLSPADVEATINRLVANQVITLSDKGEVAYPTTTRPRSTPTAATKPKVSPKPVKSPPVSVGPFARVLKHLREHPKNRPTRKTPLVRHLLTVLGHKMTEPDIFALINTLSQAGHLTIDDKGKVLYHL